MSAASCSSPVMKAFNDKVWDIIKTRNLKRDVDDIHDEVKDYLLNLEDKDLIEILSKRKTIRKRLYILPMMGYLFIDCPSEAVCRWIVQNTHLEDEGIIHEYLKGDHLRDEGDELKEWKVILANEWLENYEGESDCADDESDNE